MKKILLFYILFTLTLLVNAQHYKEVWLINGRKTLGKNVKKYKIGFTFDARNTFIGTTNAKLGGLKLGLHVDRIHQIGIGVYGMNKPLNITQIPNSTIAFYSAKVRFSYISIFYERVLFFDKKWEWSTAVHFGAGKIQASYVPQEFGKDIYLPKIETRPIEVSTTMFHHFTYWISVGGGVGYRVMRKTPDLYKPYFNGPIYLVKVKIRLFKLMKSVVNKEVKNEY